MLSLVLRRGFSRGLLEGNRAWLIAGTGALLIRGLRWAARKEPEVVYREAIAPGETLVLSREQLPPTRRERRREKRAARRQTSADAG